MRSILLIIPFFSLSLLLASCSGGESATATDKAETTTTKLEVDNAHGVGPISSVELTNTIDEQLALRGQEVFEAKCAACHNFEDRYVGPSMSGVTDRREPEWIMNMILNPEEMTKEDPTAKALLREYMTQMTYQNVTQEDARAILEYFRQQDLASISQN